MFLLDTVVLSELRKPSRQRNPNLVRWIGALPSSDLFISVVTIGEIERGIDRQRQTDREFSQRLASWLEVVLRAYEDRILVVDVAVARQWGRLSHRIGNKGLDLGNCSRSSGYVDRGRGVPASTRQIASRAPIERRRAVSMTERMSP